jgi:hypothetical protein
MATVCKLLALIAVLLMPLGMQSAAASVTHDAAMPMEHCPDQAPTRDLKGGFAECTMVCSAALPAADPLQREHPLIACAPTEPAVARILHGLHPDTATPPPKRS